MEQQNKEESLSARFYRKFMALSLIISGFTLVAIGTIIMVSAITFTDFGSKEKK